VVTPLSTRRRASISQIFKDPARVSTAKPSSISLMFQRFSIIARLLKMQRTIKIVSPVSRILYPCKGTAIICLAPPLLTGSSGLPGNLRNEQSRSGKPETISLFDLASGVVYLAPAVTIRAVGSYPAISPLTLQ